jgi:circadian clock protein KaiC
VDTWLLLRDIESRGERNRGLCILKSRGMAHSNQIREFHLTTSGVQLTDVYLGPAGVLTGAARAVREASDQAETLTRQHEIERKQRQFARKRQVLEARIELLRGLFADEEDDLMTAIDQERARQLALIGQRTKTAGVRRADQLLPALTTRSSARRPRASRGGG